MTGKPAKLPQRGGSYIIDAKGKLTPAPSTGGKTPVEAPAEQPAKETGK